MAKRMTEDELDDYCRRILELESDVGDYCDMAHEKGVVVIEHMEIFLLRLRGFWDVLPRRIRKTKVEPLNADDYDKTLYGVKEYLIRFEEMLKNSVKTLESCLPKPPRP